MSQPPPDGRRCAVCGKPQAAPFRPFCSKRCTDVDLARWLGGRYAIPTQEAPETGLKNEDDDV